MATTKYIDIKIRSRSAEKKVDSLDKSMVRLGEDTDKTSKSFGALSKVAVAIGAALSIRQVIQYADSWTNVGNRLRAATKSNNEFITAQKGVIAIAQEAGVGLSGVADSYSRIAQNTEHLGLSQERTLDITRKLTLAIKAGGATSQEAASTLVQFGQGLGTNALQGEELKAIMEASIPVTKALAKEFGVNTGQLKKLGSEGKLTADRVVSAIENMDKKSLTFTKSMTDGFTEVSNALTIYVGGIDESLGATKTLGGGLSLLAKNIDLVVNGATALVVLIGARYSGALGVAAAATIAKSNANAKLVTSELALLKTAQARATQEALAAIQQQAAAKRQLAMAHATGINSKAITNLAIANGRVIATQTALTATTTAYTTAARGATIASRTLSASMAFLGGPLGVALIAAAALFAFNDIALVTEEASEGAAKGIDEITAAMSALQKQTKKQVLIEIIKIEDETLKKLGIAEEKLKLLNQTPLTNRGRSTLIAQETENVRLLNIALTEASKRRVDLVGGINIPTDDIDSKVKQKPEEDTKSFDSLFARLKLETDAIKSEEEVRKAFRDGLINQQQMESELALQNIYFQYEARRVAILENEKLTADQKAALILELTQQEIDAEALRQAELTGQKKEGTEDRIALDNAELQSKIQMTQGILGLMQTFAGGSKKASKALMLIQAGMSAFQIYASSEAAAAMILATPPGPILNPALVPAAAAVSAKGKISAAGVLAGAATGAFSGGGGGGGGVSATSSTISSSSASSPSVETPQQNRVIDIRLDDDAILTGSAVKQLMTSLLNGDDDITLQITSNQAELTRTGAI